MKKIGFIGCGNMAGAIISGIIAKGIYQPEEIIVSRRSESALAKIKTEMNVKTTVSNREVAGQAKIIVLSVKPQFYESVIAEIADVVTNEQIIVTIAPGKTLEWLDSKFGRPLKMVRTMPNTPALVGEGITAVTPNQAMSEDEIKLVCHVLEGCGKVEIVPESMMDVVVSVSGSSPAYVYMFIEAMADAAVADGMPRAQAYQFAAQAVYGSAKMVLETGKHPGELKDMVCSPGGTTIEAVRVLEREGLRSSVIEAMKACTGKARGM